MWSCEWTCDAVISWSCSEAMELWAVKAWGDCDLVKSLQGPIQTQCGLLIIGNLQSHCRVGSKCYVIAGILNYAQLHGRVHLCISMHVHIYIYTEQAVKKKVMREGEMEKKTLLSTPAPWWQFAVAPLTLRCRLWLGRSGSPEWIVWGFLRIAPPLLPEAQLWSLHTFKFQRGQKIPRGSKAHSFINAATGILMLNYRKRRHHFTIFFEQIMFHLLSHFKCLMSDFGYCLRNDNSFTTSSDNVVQIWTL